MIGIEVTGDREAALRFEEFPQQLRERLRAALEKIEERLAAAVKAAAPARSGQLRSQIGGRVYEYPQRIAAVVGVRIEAGGASTKRGSGGAGKAAALEYGSHRRVDVRGHVEARTNFFGRLADPRGVEIAAHSRMTNIAERRFLRGPAASLRGQFLEELRAAVAGAGAEEG